MARAAVLAVALATVVAGIAVFFPADVPWIAALHLPPDGVLPVAVFLFYAGAVQAVASLRTVRPLAFTWWRLPFEYGIGRGALVYCALIELVLAVQAYGTPMLQTVGLIVIPAAVSLLLIVVLRFQMELDDRQAILVSMPENLPQNPLASSLVQIAIMVAGYLFYVGVTAAYVLVWFLVSAILFRHTVPNLSGFAQLEVTNADLVMYGVMAVVILVAAFVSARHDRFNDAKRFDR
jgi:hypothetical protein